MKLIAQKKLFYQDGSSDKVYEVDLCEVGTGRFVVNYRYGRRGSTLREGAETPSPVPQAEAQRIFDRLVGSKLKKGYRELLSAVPPAHKPSPAPAQPSPRDATAHKDAVLRRLSPQAQTQAKGKGGKKAWPSPRAIWRAGEMALPEAVPLFLQLLLSSGTPVRDYAIAWALARCARALPADSPHLPPTFAALGRLANDAAGKPEVRHIAAEALRLLSDEKARAARAADLASRLPLELGPLARNGTPAAFQQALSLYLSSPEALTHHRYDVLETLYLIDSPAVRPALLDALRNAPLRPGAFRTLRRLLKAAELRRDGEVFGLLAYRVEKERPFYRKGRWRTYVTCEGRSLQSQEVVRERAAGRLAFSEATRTYLRRRAWRTLRRLGQLGDPDYVNLAVGVLLPFSDADGGAPRERSHYDYRTRKTSYTRWDTFSPFWAFNHVLYGRSTRYRPQRNAKAFRCAPSYRPGGPDQPEREESFPHLWEARPAGLLHLLAESACTRVHLFAVKALRDMPRLLSELDIDTVLMLLSRPFEATARLGFDLARERYQPAAPDHTLVQAMSHCAYAPGREQARRWIDEDRPHFLKDPDLLASLCTGPHRDTRSYARDLLASSLLPAPAAQALIARLVATLLAGSDEALTADLAEILLRAFAMPLRSLGVPVLLDLLRHPLQKVQELGATILLTHELPAAQLPDDVLSLLLRSPFEPVRGIGARLLGQLPDQALLTRAALLAALSAHELPDLRAAIRPVLRRLAGAYPAFAQDLGAAFLSMLSHKESAEGVHAHLCRLLREDLSAALARVPREAALALCDAPSVPAQELAATLLQQNIAWADHTGIAAIVHLASHEIKAIREASWAYLRRALPRLQADPVDLAQGVRVLEATWEDSRAFGFALCREHLDDRHLTPTILIGICDSVREDVQALGRELITRFFTEESGPEYLLKLSEHPQPALQLFATNYLTRYAADQPERLRALTPYFHAVLCQVNRGGLARRRVHDFLRAEALKHRDAAEIVAEILGRHSATMAIMDRARCIETLLAIGKTYPDIPVPLQVKAPRAVTQAQARRE
jgi:predicted DNA-binding WGR domain protein